MSKKFSHLALTIVLLPMLFFASCANTTSVQFRTDPAHPIRSIHVARDIPLPKQMVFYGFSQSMMMGMGAAVGGAVGAGVMAGATVGRTPPNDMGLRESLTKAFSSELRRSGQFTVSENDKADAELKLVVKQYGFFQAGVMRRGVKPILQVQAQLVRRDGKIVWDQTRFISQASKSTHAELPEKLRENPDLAARSLRDAAQKLAADLVNSLPH